MYHYVLNNFYNQNTRTFVASHVLDTELTGQRVIRGQGAVQSLEIGHEHKFRVLWMSGYSFIHTELWKKHVSSREVPFEELSRPVTSTQVTDHLIFNREENNVKWFAEFLLEESKNEAPQDGSIRGYFLLQLEIDELIPLRRIFVGSWSRMRYEIVRS